MPENWKKVNVIPVFNKGEKEDPQNYQPVSLSSMPGKVMMHLILEAIFYPWEKQEIYIFNQYYYLLQ